jgi:hypothetical protein
MKTNRLFKLQLATLLLSTLNPQLSTVLAQGSLTPPGAPGPTMKSLDQIEARTPISAAPFTITQPGSYYLTHNLTVSTGDGIDINTNGVTLDLNGFTISSTAASATGNGILLNSGLRNITILNGFIQGGVTNNNGIYGGSGFGYGIEYSGNSPVNVLVSRISVSGCLYDGIYLNTGNYSTVVESCTVRAVGSYGIYASTIKSSSATDCGGSAIYGDQVSDCRGQSSGSGYGLYATTALDCYGSSSSGYGLYAITAENCNGYGNSYGLAATTALNCYGYSNKGNYGLYTSTALNCYGYGSGSGSGLYATYSATGCYGYSDSGTGLSAFIANVCHGAASLGGTALSTTHNVNSY